MDLDERYTLRLMAQIAASRQIIDLAMACIDRENTAYTILSNVQDGFKLSLLDSFSDDIKKMAAEFEQTLLTCHVMKLTHLATNITEIAKPNNEDKMEVARQSLRLLKGCLVRGYYEDNDEVLEAARDILNEGGDANTGQGMSERSIEAGRKARAFLVANQNSRYSFQEIGG